MAGADTYLTANPEELRETAVRIAGKANDMQALLDRINISFRNAADSWDSEAGKAFREREEVLTKEIAKSIEELTEYVSDILKAADIYKDVEAKLNSPSAAIADADGIF